MPPSFLDSHVSKKYTNVLKDIFYDCLTPNEVAIQLLFCDTSKIYYKIIDFALFLLWVLLLLNFLFSTKKLILYISYYGNFEQLS